MVFFLLGAHSDEQGLLCMNIKEMYQIKHTINIILTLWYFSFGKVFVRLLQNFLVRFGRLEFQCVTPEGERKEKVP